MNHHDAQTPQKENRCGDAETNPLIWFPAQMLAAGGNLTITANPNVLVPKGKGYNLRSKNGLDGLVKVRDWIDNAYCFYLDILEDPMTAVEDELLAANDYDFLDCPKGMSPFGKERRKWCIGQVMNRKPKASDSKRLRIATFIVSLLDYEDLYERPPDEIYTYRKWYIIYNSLHRHWRITLSKFIDFAVKNKPELNVEKILQSILSTQTEQGKQLSAIEENTRPRKDKDGKHKHTARGWRTQAEVAADFSKQAKKIGGRSFGGVNVERVKDWERRYPNETKRERISGYHAGLRNTANPTREIKRDYFNAAANWNEYWRLHNEAYSAWLKQNPKWGHDRFLQMVWDKQRPGKTVHRNDTDKTKLYGANTSLTDALDSGEFDNGT